MTVVFLLNAFIFTEVGIRFHQIVAALHEYSPLAADLVGLRDRARLRRGAARVDVRARTAAGYQRARTRRRKGRLVARGAARAGRACAAASRSLRRSRFRSKPRAGPFPFRDLLIFITFVVLLVTLIGQGGTLPWLIRWLNIKDDGAAVREERLALMATARAGLDRLDRARTPGQFPRRTSWSCTADGSKRRLAEFTRTGGETRAARKTATFPPRARRARSPRSAPKLIELRARGKIDNTVLRRLQRVFDLEAVEIPVLESTGHADIEE